MFEYLEQTLESDMVQRLRHGSSYAEDEIWYILSSCAQALQYFKLKGILSLDLSLNSIFLTKERRIKLCEYIDKPL